VQVRGYQARFTLRTDWGDFEAESVEMLAVRVAEMPALRAVSDDSVTAAVARAGYARGLEPLRAVGNVVRHPVQTVTGLPGGVVRYLSRRWQSLRRGARRLADATRDELTQEGDPYRRPDAPLAHVGNPPERENPGFWRQRGRDLAHYGRDEIGYSQARQRLAAQLGIDARTTHPLLKPRLDSLAWAETSGRLAGGELLTLLAGGAAAPLSQAARLNALVHEPTPIETREDNQRALLQHCSDAALVRAFIRHGAFTPALQSQLVALHGQLQPASGCEALLETALMAQTQAQARFMVAGVALIAHQLGASAHGGNWVPQGAWLAYESNEGEFVLSLAADWLSWTPRTRRWFDMPVISRHPRRMLVLSGGISPLAMRALSERGWSIVTFLPYPGAPPYRRLAP
jgi:hypothetical protein